MIKASNSILIFLWTNAEIILLNNEKYGSLHLFNKWRFLFCFVSSLWKLGNKLSSYCALPSLHPFSLPTMGQYFYLASRTLKVEILPPLPSLACRAATGISYVDMHLGLEILEKQKETWFLKTDFLTWGFDLIFRTESRNLNLEWLWGSSSCWVPSISLLGFIKGKMTY